MTDADALIRRARRGANSIIGGDRLLAALTSPRYTNPMKEAVAKSLPPVSAISKLLLQDFENVVDLKAHTVRQFIGSTVRAVLAAEGFEVHESGIRLPRDKVFRTGSTYRKIAVEDADVDSDEDLLARIVSVLTVKELVRLRALVGTAL